VSADKATGPRDEDVGLWMRVSMQAFKIRGLGPMNQSRKALPLLGENNVAVGPESQKSGELLKQKPIDLFDR
jgi:hypothetical protein